jgi:2,3-bisphosphoglycerate-dependent phosphoglycerate mutase
MKNSFSIALLLLFQHIAIAQLPKGISGKTALYFVRHGEKENGKDPVLTTAGKERAGDLMRTLKHKHIKRIYATQFKRTQMTGDSLRIQLGIDTIHYNADTTGIDLFNKIAAQKDYKKHILIIGHSNTIDDYIRKAGVKNYPKVDIPDNEFDNIYKVYYRRPFLFCKLKAHVKIWKYGKL